MRNKLSALIGLLPLLTAPVSAMAADQTAISMGFGATSCAEFAQRYTASTSVENDYFDWAQGFMSGFNVALGSAKVATRDLNAATVEDQKIHIRYYCEKHPLETFEDAATDLYFSLPLVPAPK